MTPEALQAKVGSVVGRSRWFAIPQGMIDDFARLTEDEQFIHVDPERAAASPFGGTIAHGFLTLSMLSAMAYDAQPEIDGETHAVNYGFDRVRFLSPVAAGARIRAVFTLDAFEQRGAGELALTWGVTMEIEGAAKPALAAIWLQRRYLEVA
ncbi:MAG: Nodulation protein N [Rhodobacterales bacterium]|nr:MAG: Nodulation protein N [Rhodobacterales bacterium]